MAGHISDDDLERLVLRMVRNEAELQRIEEHLLACGECPRRLQQTRQYVRDMKAALANQAQPEKASCHMWEKRKGA